MSSSKNINKKVAIAGYGLEGKSAYLYFKSLGADVAIVDENLSSDDMPEGADFILGKEAFAELRNFDLISRSPSIRPDSLPVDIDVTSATIEFFKACPAQIIGVTGTKGKGTTSMLIAGILESAGRKVHTLGNIGVPALGVLQDIEPEDLVIYEISSFQLWDMKQSPHVAVVLMMGADHQDIHNGMQEYIDAKKNISSYQSSNDVVIYHPKNIMSYEVANNGSGEKRKFMTQEAAFIRGESIFIDEHKVCSISEVGLIGFHNLENVTAAISAAWIFTQNVDAIHKAVVSFTGLAHRLEFVKSLNDVDYYNDSFSSALSATIAAMRSFEQPKVLILGGKDKLPPLDELVAEVKKTRFRKILLIGEMSQRIATVFDDENVAGYMIVKGGMQEIVNTAKNEAKPGDIVLLSPGTSSYDMFKNFKDRGEQYKKVVNLL